MSGISLKKYYRVINRNGIYRAKERENSFPSFVESFTAALRI